MSRAVGCAVLLTGAAVLDQVLYETFVVPRLPEWNRVPMVWWLVVAGPVLVTALAVGFFGASLKQLAAVGAIAALLNTLFLAWAANAQRPGHLKSIALEAPVMFWLLAPVFQFLLLSAPMAVGYYVSRAVKPTAR